jgi:soluble lytic murein transglycosylase
MGLPFSRGRLTDDPDYNVRLGQAYLSELLDQFDGSYILALAAYNAGPNRAKSWIGLYGDPRDPSVDPINWIERIPFTETRNYVQRILESLVVYRDGNPEETTRWALQLPPAGS